MYVYVYACLHAWACGVVVRMFDFHRRDRGSNPDQGGEIFLMITTILYCDTIGKCLKTICHGSPKPCGGNWDDGNCSEASKMSQVIVTVGLSVSVLFNS